MSNIGKIIRVSALPPIEARETNVIYQVAAPGAVTYTDYAIDENGDLKTHAVVDGTIPLELADDHISITNQDLITEGIVSQAHYNAYALEKLEQKLSMPSIEGNAQDYPKIIGLDSNGNIAKLPAGDLGKNMMNADLSNTSARNHTFNAPFSINTLGNEYKVAGLPNKNADISNFQKVMVQNTAGLNAVVDGKNFLIGLPNQLTDAEKTAWKTQMNGGWTTNTMSVASISPSLVKLENEVSYIVLKGANLNLNPASFTIQIMDETGVNVLATVPNSQVQLDNSGVSLTFYYNFHSLGANKYKVRLWNGIAYYITPVTVEVIGSITQINLSNLTWNTKVYNDNSTSFAYALNNVIYFNPDNSIKPPAVEIVSVFNAKTQAPLFNAGENWYLEMTISAQAALSPIQSIGFSTSNLTNLTNDIFGGLEVSGNGFITSLGGTIWANTQGFKLVLIKKGQTLTKILSGVLYNNTPGTITATETISNTDDLYFGTHFNNMHATGNLSSESYFNINLIKAYKF